MIGNLLKYIKSHKKETVTVAFTMFENNMYEKKSKVHIIYMIQYFGKGYLYTGKYGENKEILIIVSMAKYSMDTMKPFV